MILIGRSPAKLENLASELDAECYLADFTRLDEVRALGAQLRADLPRIDVLANNAGGVMGAPQLTVDGNEATLQVNHLAPFLLTNLLIETLLASRATVVATSSVANRGAGTLNLDDINLGYDYTPELAYSRAKLMNILFTKELHNRFHTEGIAAAAFHPGIVRTSFAREFPNSWSFVYCCLSKSSRVLLAKGADTLVWLATSAPDEDWRLGEFYKDRRIREQPHRPMTPNLRRAFWELSAKLTKLD